METSSPSCNSTVPFEFVTPVTWPLDEIVVLTVAPELSTDVTVRV